MSKVVQRLLVFFIGIPLVLFVVFVPFLDRILFSLMICTFTFFAADELYNLFSATHKLLPKSSILACSVALPAISYLIILFNFPTVFITWVLIFILAFILSVYVLTAKNFDGANECLALSSFIIVYTGYTTTFLQRIISLENGTFFQCLFFCMVFICDSFAWLFGMTLGKSNRGVIAVSPNKSVAGFIGGYLGSILVAVLADKFLPHIFDEFWKALVLGSVTATAAILGDLLESVFKRSAKIKDSGKLMPGRGGILDSIDSIIFAAPFYFILLHLLYGFAL